MTDPRLKKFNAFTLWREEPNARNPAGKPLKVPVHYDGKTHHSRLNPAPLLSWEHAQAWAAHTGCRVGFRPTPEMGLACLDMDGSIGEDGRVKPESQRLLDFFSGAFVEVSVSGRGLHIWFTYRGDGPGKRGKVVTPVGELEIYSDGQFIALGTPRGGSAATDCTTQMQWVLENYFHRQGSTREDVRPADWEGKSERERAECVADLRSALAALDLSTYDEWIKAGQNLACLGDIGLDLWDEASARAAGYSGRDEVEWKFGTFSGDRSDYRSIFARASRAGWEQPRRTADPTEVFGVVPVELPEGATTEAPAASTLSFSAAANGALPATPATVFSALMGDESGYKIGFDDFKGMVMLGDPHGNWRPMTDLDYTRIRVALEQRGFKQVPLEIARSCIDLVADCHRFDSAIEWGRTLKWDGVKRIDTSLSTYFGAPDTPYTRAVGAYAWTAMAGRLMSPGVQADMAVILVGLQGAGKTTAIASLAPTPDAFCEVDLAHKDDNLARMLRGKLVAEIAEMKGMRGRQSESTKAFITRRTEEWIPKYRELAVRFQRRVVFWGSANEHGLLDDATGERRWLPVEVTGRVKPAQLRKDRDQLWAEGVARFGLNGVEWEQAQELAKPEHAKFKVVDERQEIVARWLAQPRAHIPGQPVDDTPNGARLFTIVEVAVQALGYRIQQVGRSEQMAIGKILSGLGYESKTVWDKEVRALRRGWVKA